MKSPWARLALFIVTLAVALAAVQRLPHRAPASPSVAPPAPLDTLVVTVTNGVVSPDRAAFPLGHRLALTRVNGGRAAVRISLAGYEHQLAEVPLAPGEARADTFTLDLPGEDFAWRVDGAPVGQLRVSGSHLVAGHR